MTTNATLQDYTFLFNRKGALYPIDYNTNRLNELENERKDKLDLKTLCCKEIIQNRSLFKSIMNNDKIPNEIYRYLLKTTLNLYMSPVTPSSSSSSTATVTNKIQTTINSDDIIDELIRKWPYKRLILSQYIQIPSIKILYNDIDLYKYTRICIKHTADIIHSYIESLRQTAISISPPTSSLINKTRLRFLDLTNLPIAEILIKYIATHSRLAQKEYQRNLLIDEYMKNISDLKIINSSSTANTTSSNTSGLSIRTDLKKSTSLPTDEPLIFRFDCLLQERSTYDELMSALNVDNNYCFKLNIVKLDILCLGTTNIIRLLNKLDHQYVEGLRLQYNSIKEENLHDLLDIINLLKNLKSLDISCNLIDLRSSSLPAIEAVVAATASMETEPTAIGGDDKEDELQQRENDDGDDSAKTTMTPIIKRDICKRLNETFLVNLKKLKRLDLSNCKLTNKISELFDNWPCETRKLEYLCLKSCLLNSNDLKYLIKMSKSSETSDEDGNNRLEIKHLNLSDNSLNRYFDDLKQLIYVNRSTLHILELDDNHFNSIDYLHLINFIYDNCLLSSTPSSSSSSTGSTSTGTSRCASRNLKLLSIKGKYYINDHLYAIYKLTSSFLTSITNGDDISPLLIYRISYPIDIYLNLNNNVNNNNEDQRREQQDQNDIEQNTKRLFLNKLLNIIQNKYQIVVHELFL